ncbi:MAG: asparagine synthase (glutamine-hydrolyzing) [Christensenellaceae bacterium]|jgi:asparagine synthase (glutamine-hydrolysing)|nr:asparagine synthase (glutamine-hydrolyzing) [Christensenellaceae bacterium]
MCGIAGQVDYNNSIMSERTAQEMAQTLKNRGPDATGIYWDQRCVFIHNRLIVVDPKNGCQPMKTAYDDEYVIVYNGELYNTEEIREDLAFSGYVFRGYSDTEVLLKAYICWGEACLDRLNGIFAFAIWSVNTGELFLARDRIGVKPLFYFRYVGGLIFASEIKTLLVHPRVPHKVDEYSMKQILLLGPSRATGIACVKDVYELKPGEFLKTTTDSISKRIYWKLMAREHIDNERKTIEKTRELICNAIKRQLVSDVELGCFLSGGLDSSIISKVVADEYAKKNMQLSTYSVDYEGNDRYFTKSLFQPDADNLYINLMSEFIRSKHTSILLNSLEVADAITDATIARTLPGMGDIDSSLLLFCKKIKESVTVCLSGECADEIFGGYPWYHNIRMLYSDTFPWSDSVDIRKKLFTSDVIGINPEKYIKDEYENTISKTDVLESDSVQDRRMREMFVLNFYWFMQTLLDRKDRMSMYSGLEVRVPFCDHKLVEYAYNMPWRYKSLNGREKGIVREAFKDILPKEIIQRKKSPYPKTFNPLFFEYVVKKTDAILSSKDSIIGAFVNKKYLETLKLDPALNAVPWYGQLMKAPQIFAYLIQLEHFFKSNNLSY